MDVDGERFDEPLEAAKDAPWRGRPGHRPGRRRTCRGSSDEFKAIVQADTGRDFPTDPYEQLDLAIKAVFASWFGKRARDYRKSQKIAHDLGTAVNVVTMVFGNMGDDSGTGVAFTRDPNTGENDALRRVPHQRPGRGRRRRHPDARRRSARWPQDMPGVYDEFQRIGQQLERHYRDVQDLEFTIERGRLYMLQTRSRQADRRGRRARSRSTWSTRA